MGQIQQHILPKPSCPQGNTEARTSLNHPQSRPQLRASPSDLVVGNRLGRTWRQRGEIPALLQHSIGQPSCQQLFKEPGNLFVGAVMGLVPSL